MTEEQKIEYVKKEGTVWAEDDKLRLYHPIIQEILLKLLIENGLVEKIQSLNKK